MPASNARQVYEANMMTFRAFRDTIDDLKNHPFALLGDQASLVRRVQEWRKTIGHLTVWLQDVRAYYEQARPEIVVLLEHTFDSISEIDKVRNGRETTGILKVTDHDFVNILVDYIRLIETAFSPDRQKLYSTPDDQGPLKRGQILFRGLHSFHKRLESVKARNRRGSVSHSTQASPRPVSPVTPTQPVRQSPSAHSLARQPKPVPANYQQPIHRIQQPAVHSNLPANAMVPSQQHSSPPKPQFGFIRPAQSFNPTPNVAWNQPAVQQRLPTQAPPNTQQVQPRVPSNAPAIIPPAPPEKVEAINDEKSAMHEEMPEQDVFGGLTWEELEALDRSEWDETTATNDKQTHEDKLMERPISDSYPGPLTSQPLPKPPSAIDHPSESGTATGKPSPPDQNDNNYGPVPAHIPTTPPAVAKEEAQSPRALLQTPPPASSKSLSRLERRQSQLAASVIDIDELSDDESSVDEPRPSTTVPAPVVGVPGDIVNIDDSDEEGQMRTEPTEPLPDSPLQSPVSALPWPDPPNIASHDKATPRPASDPHQSSQAELAIPDVTQSDPPLADHPVNDAQSTNDMANVLPAEESPKQLRPGGHPEPMRPGEPEPLVPPDMKVGSHGLNRGDALVAQTRVISTSEDVEMANGEYEGVPVNSGPNVASDTSNKGVEESLALTPSYKSIKDVNQLTPELRLQIRERAQGPLLKWYTARTGLSWEDAKTRYNSLTDQDVFDLYLKIMSSVERHKAKPENTTFVTAAPPPRYPTESPVSVPQKIDETKLQPAQESISCALPKLNLPPGTLPEAPSEPPVLLCALVGLQRIARGTVEFDVSTELMAGLTRWKSRYTNPVGSHGELWAIELACYAPESVYFPTQSASLTFTPNAQIRTWPNAGILRAFINQGTHQTGEDVHLWLSPPPFSKIDEPIDLSEHVREGRNTIKFVHFGGMESFVFVVQARKMSPPGESWPNILKRIQEFTENAGYQGLLSRLSETTK